MIEERPRTLLSIALGLLLFGWVMPFLMAIHAVESTFTLNFLYWGASVAVASLVRRRSSKGNRK